MIGRGEGFGSIGISFREKWKNMHRNQGRGPALSIHGGVTG